MANWSAVPLPDIRFQTVSLQKPQSRLVPIVTRRAEPELWVSVPLNKNPLVSNENAADEYKTNLSLAPSKKKSKKSLCIWLVRFMAAAKSRA